MVLGGGRLVELGTPSELLATPASALSSMAAALGPEARERLEALANGGARE